MRIIIASHNPHKIVEFKELYDGDFVSLSDIGFDEEIIEDGHSYLENAEIKVKAIQERFPDDLIIGDDSGFSVRALNHEPGIYSARYLSHLSQQQKNEKILELLKDVTDRRATFTCAMVLSYHGHTFHTQEVVYGTIPLEPQGSDGFGYDPIFIPDGYEQSFAQNHELKKKVSHRALALRKIIAHVQYLQD